MGLLANPDKKIIKVPVHGGSIVSTLRMPTTEELLDYRRERHKIKPGSRNPFDDRSDAHKIKMYDRIVLGVSAEDDNEMPTELQYRDRSGNIHPLTPEVENWKQHISVAAKIASMSFLDRMDAEEADLEKN